MGSKPIRQTHGKQKIAFGFARVFGAQPSSVAHHGRSDNVGRMEDVKLSLAVNISKQGSRFVAYSPALDISTSGKDEVEAKRRFGELVDIFFEELQESGATEDVLTELGWNKSRPAQTHAASQWLPPRTVQVEVRVPALA